MRKTSVIPASECSLMLKSETTFMRIYKFRCWENIRRKTVLWHLLCVWMCCLICAGNPQFFFARHPENLSLLHWPGRMEVLRSKPFVLLDACINATSCENVKEVLRHLGVWNCTVIVGIPEDKDYAGVVRSMKGMANRIILTRSGNPHYHFPKTAGDIGRRRYWHNMDRFRETGTDSGRFLSGSHCNLGNDFGNFRSRADFQQS